MGGENTDQRIVEVDDELSRTLTGIAGVRDGLAGQLPDGAVAAFLVAEEHVTAAEVIRAAGRTGLRQPDVVAFYAEVPGEGRAPAAAGWASATVERARAVYRFHPPVTDLQRAVSAVWSSVIGHRVGIRDDLFDLDVDSLKVVELAAALQRSGWALPTATLLDLGTIERLAAHVENTRATAVAAAPSAR
jgi:aryl carrier-like protein